MSLRKLRNSTFKWIKDGMGQFIDRDHFMGHSSMEGEHQKVEKGELKHTPESKRRKK